MWRSPNKRTRQTIEEINKSLGITDIREDITLVEQQFGMFDSYPAEKCAEFFPVEWSEYLRQKNNFGIKNT